MNATIRFLLLATSANLVWASASYAQNALGAGNALDNNLRSDSDGTNPYGPAEDYRARNLIVTGDVAGGRGFRGSVGYSADRDFRGGLGSDSTLQFRRNAAYSSPGAISSGLSASRFSSYDPIVEYRRDSTMRVIDDPRWNPDRWQNAENLRVGVDQLNGASSNRGSQMVGLTLDQDGKYLSYSASSLSGINVQSLDDDARPNALDFYDQASLRQEKLRSDAGSGSDRIENTAENAVGADNARSTRFDTSIPAYNDILQQIQNRLPPSTDAPGASPTSPESESSDESPVARAQRELDELRRRLGDPEEIDAPLTPPSTSSPPAANLNGEENSEPDTNPSDAGLDTLSLQRRIEDYAGLIRHGAKIASMAQSETSRLNELLTQGEASLKAGAYFDAQDRFDRALRIQSHHPLADAGLAHARIGAGLNLAAGVTLRLLFTRNPEMIDVQFDRSLLPDDQRLQAVIDAIRTRLAQPDDTASVMGLVIAYIGRQIHDEALIVEGLDQFARGPMDAKLVALLRSVWLAPETQPEKDPLAPGPDLPPTEEPEK